MTLLLALPAIAVVLFLGRGLGGSLRLAWLMAQVQLLIGTPFWVANGRGYLARAFELSRQFLYKWTVNWRFVAEETFLSKKFSVALLLGHVSVLSLFLVSRWLDPSHKSLSDMVPSLLRASSPFTPLEEVVVSGYVTAKFSLTTILSANVIGLLFARSLHYQFYAYLAWSTPYLLWRAGMPFPLIPIVWVAQEWAWNVYPSTDLSSAVVVGSLALQVAALWLGTADEEVEEAPLPQKPTVKEVASKQG